MTGTQADLARHLGVNKSSVSRAVRAGRLVPEPDGLFDFAKCTAAWHASSGHRADVAARHAAQRGAGIPQANRIPENRPAADLAGQGPGVDLPLPDASGRQKAQATRLHYENQQLKLAMALRIGLRLDRHAVRQEASGLGALLRAGIERLIDQTAPRLAASGNALERRRILAAEIRRLRWVTQRELPRGLRRMKQAGQKVGAGGVGQE